MSWLYCSIPQKLQEYIQSYIYEIHVRLHLLNFLAYIGVCEEGGESEAGRKEHYKAKKSWLGR